MGRCGSGPIETCDHSGGRQKNIASIEHLSISTIMNNRVQIQSGLAHKRVFYQCGSGRPRRMSEWFPSGRDTSGASRHITAFRNFHSDTILRKASKTEPQQC